MGPPRSVERRLRLAVVADREPALARHETPEIDAAALVAGRAAEVLLAAAVAAGSTRWTRYLGAMPDRFRDEPIPAVKAAARAGRSAFGVKDSIRDTLPASATEPFLVAIDRLLKVIARWEMHRYESQRGAPRDH